LFYNQSTSAKRRGNMPGPSRNLRHLPRVHDNLRLVKRFVEEVPVKGRAWQAFQRTAAEALEEVILILLPTGFGLPCPKKVLPKGLKPFLATLPCRTKVMQRMVEGGLAAVRLAIPICGTVIPRKNIQPLLTAVATGMPRCGRTILPRNVQPPVIRKAKAAPRRKR
jgi:hypothetical protein